MDLTNTSHNSAFDCDTKYKELFSLQSLGKT